MDEFSILIGGKAGDGIDRASLVIASIFNRLGYCIYVYRDYPSIIRGGHTFSIIRASRHKVYTHKAAVDIVLAMNRETAALHKNRLKPGSVLVYDQETIGDTTEVDSKGIRVQGIPLSTIVKEEEAPSFTRNSGLIGAMGKVIGIEWGVLEEIFRKKLPKMIKENLSVAHRVYDAADSFFEVGGLKRDSIPMLTGNEALGLGLIRGELNTYIAYPMTPTSSVLHFLAGIADRFDLKVIHPESEIGVMLMALGSAYTGERVAVGTSGGGFCLMTEGFSLAGMAELPVVVVLGQRPGPSTGLPTYSSQTELHFALNAGQGEFTRFVVAPGDAEESYYWAQIVMGIADKHRIPAIILTDKNLGEGTYSFDLAEVKLVVVAESVVKKERPKVFKVNGYEHDEDGITTEDPITAKSMQDGRLAKTGALAKDLQEHTQVGVYGDKSSASAVLCWGSNKGVVVEAAASLGLKVIQPIVMSPFPVDQFREALTGVGKIVTVENNATAQLVTLIQRYGFDTDETILKYDGRAFAVDELEVELSNITKGWKK